jgi:hypothetical protein
MRTITNMPPDLTQVLFIAGSRKPMLVENESERDLLRRQFREQLSELEFFALGNAERMQRLSTEMSARSSREQPVAIVDHEMSDAQASEVFDLRPLSTQRVTLKVNKNEPARFYFVDEDDVPAEDEAEKDGKAA